MLYSRSCAWLCLALYSSALLVNGKVGNENHTVMTAADAPRMVAFVNCPCGFGKGEVGKDSCTTSQNMVYEAEKARTMPVTHYVISFLSFDGSKIQSDPGAIWKNGGGSTGDFALDSGIGLAMQEAVKNGKILMLSLGGELGSSQFLQYYGAKGSTSEERVKAMRQDILAVIDLFEHQNSEYSLVVGGFDIDIELGGGYELKSEKYIATRDLINAVPDELVTSFDPQIGNGLCAAAVLADLKDGLTPVQVLGGQCMSPASDGAPWTLTQLDKDCKRSNGKSKLDWFGIQYYNAVEAVCCGGGSNKSQEILSITQNFKNLAKGWPEVTAADMEKDGSPWKEWRWWPGPWQGFEGIGADRLVLGKPSCSGCAGSNYLSDEDMNNLFASLSVALQDQSRGFGGVLFWDLCRLYGNQGNFCVNGHCQPSWAGAGSGVAPALKSIYGKMGKVHPGPVGPDGL